MLAGIVDCVRQQSQETGSLDRLNDPGLLLSRSTGAAGRVDLPNGIEKLRQYVEAFVVNLLELELGGELFSSGPAGELSSIRPADGA